VIGVQGQFQQPHLMCRAHPPHPSMFRGNPRNAAEMNLTALYPIVDPNGTCGEYEAAIAIAS
jgi:hypothetical protein